MKDILKKDINYTNIDKNIILKLKQIDITYVYELCMQNRKSLKNAGFSSKEISDIIVKLQLQGLDLNKKYKVKL